jgi:cytochrome b561
MTTRLHYGKTAKSFHWLIAALLAVQYLIGWLMPDIHRGMVPGAAMVWHVSIGSMILALIVLRFAWRLAHPVAPENSLPAWQQLSSTVVHWGLYVLVLVTALSGWSFASMRGWAIAWFFVTPMPMLTAAGSPVARAVGGWHEAAEWTLLIVIGLHVAAAFLHLVFYRDRVMQRMLPG